MPLPASSFPLRVSGTQILSADGQPVRLCGVNWGGAQQDEGVPYGLDRLHRDSLAAKIAGMGLNHVRLPFATGHILTSRGSPVTAQVPAYRVAANPDLAGMTSWQVLCATVESLTAAGLYVILNSHLSFPGWCCADADNNGLWYNDNWPASTFFACWDLIAKRFAGNPYVGYDLRNEPRKAAVGGTVRTPAWGNGGGTDFRRMYEQAADTIRAHAPDALCFCEGLDYASDLTGWARAPVRRPNAVASLHDYPWFHKGVTTYGDYAAAMDRRTAGLPVPLWIGEFGTSTDVPLDQLRRFWLPWFVRWAASRGAHWCWWELGATAVLGTEPVTNAVKMRYGQREAFSLLAGQDWGGVQSDLLGLLAPLLP